MHFPSFSMFTLWKNLDRLASHQFVFPRVGRLGKTDSPGYCVQLSLTPASTCWSVKGFFSSLTRENPASFLKRKDRIVWVPQTLVLEAVIPQILNFL